MESAPPLQIHFVVFGDLYVGEGGELCLGQLELQEARKRGVVHEILNFFYGVAALALEAVEFVVEESEEAVV